MDNPLPTPETVLAFDEEGSKLCPKCGESNPDEAVICWACYCPLNGSSEAQSAWQNARQMQLAGRHEDRRTRWETRRDGFFDVLPMGGILMLIASGYARKNRALLLGAGLFALGATAWWRSEKEKRARISVEDKPPAERIADTLLLYALRDGASQVRLRAGVGIIIHYLIGDEWQEQMKIPSYVWDELCVHFVQQSDGWKHSIPFEMDGKRFEFSPHFERERDVLETLTLSLKN